MRRVPVPSVSKQHLFVRVKALSSTPDSASLGQSDDYLLYGSPG